MKLDNFQAVVQDLPSRLTFNLQPCGGLGVSCSTAWKLSWFLAVIIISSSNAELQDFLLLNKSTVFTVFFCFPTVFTTVYNGFHSFHMFCNILRRLLASATHTRHVPSHHTLPCTTCPTHSISTVCLIVLSRKCNKIHYVIYTRQRRQRSINLVGCCLRRGPKQKRETMPMVRPRGKPRKSQSATNIKKTFCC